MDAAADARELFVRHQSPHGWEITDYTFNCPARAGY